MITHQHGVVAGVRRPKDVVVERRKALWLTFIVVSSSGEVDQLVHVAFVLSGLKPVFVRAVSVHVVVNLTAAADLPSRYAVKPHAAGGREAPRARADRSPVTIKALTVA